MADINLYAGFAREDITPEIGTALYGYRPGNYSTNLHDPLFLNAVCFEQSGTRFLIFNYDLCLIETELSKSMRKMISEITSVPYNNIILSAIHTHSGPNVAGEPGWGEIDHKYIDGILIPMTKKVAERVSSSLVPVKLGIGTTSSMVGMNRRMILEDGTVVLGQNPWGPYDPNMTVMSFADINTNKPVFNIIHYGCHGTAFGETPDISRDWAGIMVDRLEEISEAPSFFMNGAIGDVGPRITNGWTGGGMSYAEELGGIASRDAINAWRTIKEWRVAPEMKILSSQIKLPYRSLPSKEYCEEEIAKVKDPESLINIFFLEYQHMVDVKEVYDKNIPIPDYLYMDQTILAIGPILFLPLPYEFFSEISLRIRQYSPYAYTLLLSNCNGSEGYFPTMDAIPRGGYEVKSFVSGHAFTLTDDADQKLIDAEMSLINKL